MTYNVTRKIGFLTIIIEGETSSENFRRDDKKCLEKEKLLRNRKCYSEIYIFDGIFNFRNNSTLRIRKKFRLRHLV